MLPTLPPLQSKGAEMETRLTMKDGRVVTVSVKPEGNNSMVRLSVKPDKDIVKYGVAIKAGADGYFTGLMERLVDGLQKETWAEGHAAAMNLRGQKVDMILMSTLSDILDQPSRRLAKGLSISRPHGERTR
jgi:hypothetical protein